MQNRESRHQIAATESVTTSVPCLIPCSSWRRLVPMMGWSSVPSGDKSGSCALTRTRIRRHKHPTTSQWFIPSSFVPSPCGVIFQHRSVSPAAQNEHRLPDTPSPATTHQYAKHQRNPLDPRRTPDPTKSRICPRLDRSRVCLRPWTTKKVVVISVPSFRHPVVRARKVRKKKIEFEKGSPRVWLGSTSEFATASHLSSSSFLANVNRFYMGFVNNPLFQSVTPIGCAAPRSPTRLDAVLAVLSVRDSFSLREEDERNDGRCPGMWTTMDLRCDSVLAWMLCWVG